MILCVPTVYTHMRCLFYGCQFSLALSVAFFVFAIGVAEGGLNRVRETVSAKSRLRHPGILMSKPMLDTMCRELRAGDPVRVEAWKDMVAHPRGTIRGSNWDAKEEIVGYDNVAFKIDAAIANSYALRWIVTGKRQDARVAVELMNEWSSTLKSIRSKENDKLGHTRLMMGVHSGYWAQAAELLRSSGAPWSQMDQYRFKKWLREVVLPSMEPRPSSFNGNWDAACTWSTMAIAVFLDDRKLFDENIKRLKSGDTNARLTYYLLPSGQCQETGRDQVHAQMGLDFLARACEIAWNQGIDLYDYKDVSIGRCFEYCARYNLGDDDVPFEVYPSPVGRSGHDAATEPSDECRGDLRPMYELVYHHYRVRKKMPMPYVEKALEQTRIEQPNTYCDYWNTLCFGSKVSGKE